MKNQSMLSEKQEWQMPVLEVIASEKTEVDVVTPSGDGTTGFDS